MSGSPSPDSARRRSAAQFLYAASPSRGSTADAGGSRFSRHGTGWVASLMQNKAGHNVDGGALKVSKLDTSGAETSVQRRNSLREEALRCITNGNFRKAVTNAIESIRIMEVELNALGEMLPECMVLTRAYFKLGDSAEARFYLNRCAKLVQREPYEDPATNAALYSMLAELYMLDSEFDRAKRLYGIYLQKMEHTFGRTHIAMSDCYNVIAAFFTTQGDYGTALEYCTKSLVIRMEQLGLNHRHTADSHFNMGLLYRLYGRPLDSRREFSIARDIRRTMFGPHSLEIAEVELSLGFTEHQLGNLPAARDLCERAYASRRQLLGKRHTDTIEALNLLDAVRVAQGASKLDPNNFTPPSLDESGRSQAWDQLRDQKGSGLFDVYVIERVTARLARQQRLTAGFATRLIQAAKEQGTLSESDIRDRFLARYPVEVADILSELHDSWIEGKHSSLPQQERRSSHPSRRLSAAIGEHFEGSPTGYQSNGKPVPFPMSPLQAQRKHHEARSNSNLAETENLVSTLTGLPGGSGDGGGGGVGSGNRQSGTMSWMDAMTQKEKEILAAENERLGLGLGFGASFAGEPGTGGQGHGHGHSRESQSPESPAGYVFASGYFDNHPLAGGTIAGGNVGVRGHGPDFGTGQGSGPGSGSGSGSGQNPGSGAGAGVGSGVGSGVGPGAGSGPGSGVGSGSGLGSGLGPGPGSGEGTGSGPGLGNYDHFANVSAPTPEGRRTKVVALSGDELWSSCEVPVFCCLGLFPMLLDKKRALDAAEKAAAQAGAEKQSSGPIASSQSKPTPSSPRPSSPKSPKKDLGPKSDTKRVHWDVLESTEGTIWDSGVESDVDFGDLLTEFSTKQAAKKEVEEAPKSKRQEVVLVADPKRRQNMAIFAKTLMKGGKDLVEVGNALREMDISRLPGSAIESLKEFLPEGDEVDAVGSFLEGGGDNSLLGPAERFVHALADIPRLEKRIQALGIISGFDESAAEVEKKAQLLLDMCKDLKSSERFVKLLQIILKVGNDLNKGTHKGGASGVRLSSLAKLAQTKSNNNMTLLEYLVNNLQDKQPEILEVVDDFPNLAEARRCNMQILSADAMKLASGLTMIRNANQAANTSGDDVEFVSATDAFLASAQAVNDAKQQLFTSAKDDYADVAKYVGEDAKVMAPEELFEHLHVFITLLNSTVRKCRDVRERKEKRERLEKAKQERAAARAGN